MRFLILLTLVAAASATIGHLEHDCPEGWDIFRMRKISMCLKLMSEPKKFEDAFKECHKIDSEMLSLVHNLKKIEFVNKLILSSELNSTAEGHTMWFFDGHHTRRNMLENMEKLINHKLTVMQPAIDPEDIKLYANAADAERFFICEKPAMATPQLAKFSRQPEDVLISDENLPQPNTEKRVRPMRVTFVCEAYAKPQPDIEWVFISENDANRTLDIEEIETKVVHDRRELLKPYQTEEPLFFEVRSDCKTKVCNAQSVVEISELVVIGAQYLEFNKTIACIASNKFGQVISREAQIVISTMEQFPKEQQTYTVIEGRNLTVPCEIETNPDSASTEWLHFVDGREGLRPVSVLDLNEKSRGCIQMSKSTSDLIIDLAHQRDSGRYICRIRQHDGRRRFTYREREINVEVVPCEKDCETKDNALAVVEDYPAVLSMNPMSNVYIRTGDDFLLECPCVGKRDYNDVLRVEWRMEQQISETLPVLPAGSAILMRNANESYSGEYSCRCVRGNGEEQQQSEWSSMRLMVLPLVAPQLNKIVEVEAGQTATISLVMPQINIDGLNVTVTPMRGNDSLNDILKEQSDDRYQLTKEGNKFSILIKNVTESDSDAYGSRVHVDYFGKWTEVDYYYASLIVKK